MPKTYLERQPGEEVVLAGKMANDLVLLHIIFGLVSEFESYLGRNNPEIAENCYNFVVAKPLVMLILSGMIFAVCG